MNWYDKNTAVDLESKNDQLTGQFNRLALYIRSQLSTLSPDDLETLRDRAASLKNELSIIRRQINENAQKPKATAH